MKPLIQLTTITQAYLEAVAFTDLNEDTEFESRDFSPDAVLQAASDCADFMRQAGTLLDDYLERQDLAQFGHDFWLTRNRHGAGFWDRGLGELGDDLTDLAHSMGGRDVYEHDDLVYLE